MIIGIIILKSRFLRFGKLRIQQCTQKGQGLCSIRDLCELSQTNLRCASWRFQRCQHRDLYWRRALPSQPSETADHLAGHQPRSPSIWGTVWGARINWPYSCTECGVRMPHVTCVTQPSVVFVLQFEFPLRPLKLVGFCLIGFSSAPHPQYLRYRDFLSYLKLTSGMYLTMDEMAYSFFWSCVLMFSKIH